MRPASTILDDLTDVLKPNADDQPITKRMIHDTARIFAEILLDLRDKLASIEKALP